jgi:hypothetical protein
MVVWKVKRTSVRWVWLAQACRPNGVRKALVTDDFGNLVTTSHLYGVNRELAL